MHADVSDSYEIADAYVSILRQVKLDNRLSLKDQKVREGTRLFPSLNIDHAVECSKCRKQMRSGFLYYPMGITETGIRYMTLDLYCPSCGKRRRVQSYSSVVLRINDEPRRRYRIFKIEHGVQTQLRLIHPDISMYASDPPPDLPDDLLDIRQWRAQEH